MSSRHRAIALIVACALFMQNLEATVLGTALPAIARAFELSPVRLHLAITAYLMSLAVFMPLSGWLVERHGTRRVFQLAVLIFSAASLACALASSLPALAAARAVQGVGGAMMVPVARLALLRAVPRNELVNAMAWVTMPALLGPVMGPALGGLIVTYASWHWIFLINLPLGLLGIALAGRFFDDRREAVAAAFDGRGFLLCGAAVAMLMLVLESAGGELLGAGTGLALLAAAAAALAAYVAHARRATAPIVDLRLLRVETFRASIVGGLLYRVGIGALPFLLPLLLQTVFAYDALDSGLITLASGLGALAMKPLVQRLLSRFGFRAVLTWNALLSAASVGVCALFDAATLPGVVFAVLFIGGWFRSLQFTAINTLAYAELDHGQMNRATGFASTAQQLSLALAVGLAAAILDLATVINAASAPGRAEFALALLIAAAAVGSSALLFSRLGDEAGNELARRGPPRGGRR